MRALREVVVAVAAFALLSAATCPVEIPDRVATGEWGGEHLGMIVSDTGAALEYDCAAGRINEPLRVARDGSFTWSGVHYPGHGGPIRIDEPTNAHDARYTGTATASRIELTISLPDGTQPPMTFTLIRGGAAHVFKCL